MYTGLPSLGLRQGGNGDPLQVALSDAYIGVVWGDSANFGGRYAPNRVTQQEPYANYLAFPTGPIMNESGGTLPTKVNYDVSWTDADGTTSATSLAYTANNQSFYLYRSVNGPALTAGTVLGLRFRARTQTSQGSKTFKIGLTTALASVTIQELDWTIAGNKANTTFDCQFTVPSGAFDITIRSDTGAANPNETKIWVDRIQLYEGGTASIPTWPTEYAKISGGRKGFTQASSIPLDANGNWDLTADSGGGWLICPQLADKSFTGITMIHVGSFTDLDAADASTVNYAVATPQSTHNSTTLSVGPNVGYTTDTGTYTQSWERWSTAFNAEMLVPGLSNGINCVGIACDATSTSAIYNEILHDDTTIPWAGMTANRFHVAAGTTTQQARVVASEVIGKHVLTAIWDRKLSYAEWIVKMALIRIGVASRGGMGNIKDFNLLSGDSNWTSGSTDWTTLMCGQNFFTPARDMQAVNTSVGGTGIAEVYGNTPYPAAMDPAGRFKNIETAILSAIANSGKKAIYWMGCGTNDFIEIAGVPAWGTTVYNNTIQNLIESALAIHPNVIVVLPTVMARGAASGSNYTNADRLTINQFRRDYVTSRGDNRVFLNDVGGTGCDLGDQTIADAGTYLIADKIHLNPSGDSLYSTFTKTFVQNMRTTLGIT
jgi:hypothetical protein